MGTAADENDRSEEAVGAVKAPDVAAPATNLNAAVEHSIIAAFAAGPNAHSDGKVVVVTPSVVINLSGRVGPTPDSLDPKKPVSPEGAQKDPRQWFQRSRPRAAVLAGVLVAVLLAGRAAVSRARHPALPAETSYRGVVRHIETGEPLEGLVVTLVGTICTSTTDAQGVFDFGSCADVDGISRITRARARITSYSMLEHSKNWSCKDVELAKPPTMTEVRLYPAACSGDGDPAMPFPPIKAEPVRQTSTPSPAGFWEVVKRFLDPSSTKSPSPKKLNFDGDKKPP
jgi:hypothetical protein